MIENQKYVGLFKAASVFKISYSYYFSSNHYVLLPCNGDEGELLWSDVSTCFVRRDAFGLNALLSGPDESLNVIASVASNTFVRVGFRHFSQKEKTNGWRTEQEN